MKKKLKIVAGLCALLLVIFVVDLLLGGALKQFGIHPRQISSIYTIYTAPFLHGGPMHLINNLFGLAIFSFLCLLRGPRYFYLASFLIITITGVLVWAFARDANHIGASGWIFGLWSLSIALAWFERSFKSIVIGVLVVIFYGGMIFGVLPTRPYISFESHLFGALAGVFVAAFLVKNKQLTR